MNYEETLSSFSDEKLEKYLLPNSIYVPDSIEAAIRILTSRGRQFSTEEIQKVENMIEQKKLLIRKQNISTWKKPWDRNIVADENAPQLYSRLSIFLFSVIFSVAVGGLLQALNCKTIGNKRGFYLTAIFGFVYSAIQIIGLTYLEEFRGETMSGLTQSIGIIGVLLLDYYFWNKFIGKETQYRKKSALKPLIICIVIFVPIVILMIYSQGK